MPTQNERSQATRTLLLREFRALLLEAGPEAATTQALLLRTKMSKGAMYHHFAGKLELIEALYRTESHSAIRRAASGLTESDGIVQQLKASCLAWVREMQDREVAKIVLEIGPRMLGHQRVTEIENELAIELFERQLSLAVERGELDQIDVGLAARLINGFMGCVAVQSDEKRAIAAATIEPAIDAILASLKTA